MAEYQGKRFKTSGEAASGSAGGPPAGSRRAGAAVPAASDAQRRVGAHAAPAGSDLRQRVGAHAAPVGAAPQQRAGSHAAPRQHVATGSSNSGAAGSPASEGAGAHAVTRPGAHAAVRPEAHAVARPGAHAAAHADASSARAAGPDVTQAIPASGPTAAADPGATRVASAAPATVTPKDTFASSHSTARTAASAQGVRPVASARGTRSAAPRRSAATGAVPPAPATAGHSSAGYATRRAPASSGGAAVAPSSYTAAVRGRKGGASGGGRGGRGGRNAGASSNGDGPRKRSILPKLLIGLGIVLLLVAAGILIHALIGYREAEDTYADLAQYAQVSDSDDSGIPSIDFDALQAVNPDIIAWIYVPGTNINYPVVQGDDNSYYLTHLSDGTYNSSGSIFLDADGTAPGMVDQQTTLYGHHMNNRSMFHEIDETVDQDAFDAIEVVYYITPDTIYRCTPLMTCVVDETFVEARQANFTGDETLPDYLSTIRGYARAEADDIDDRMGSAEQLLTLITCDGLMPSDDRAVMVLTVDESTSSGEAS